jgi:hypothetical protein
MKSIDQISFGRPGALRGCIGLITRLLVHRGKFNFIAQYTRQEISPSLTSMLTTSRRSEGATAFWGPT